MTRKQEFEGALRALIIDLKEVHNSPFACPQYDRALDCVRGALEAVSGAPEESHEAQAE